MNNWQDLINIGGAGCIATMGWFARQLWDAVNSLKADLAKLREEIAKDYVPKNDWRDFAKELREMFQIINTKLDNKADK